MGGPAIPHLDKILHAGAYGLLALILARALRGSLRARVGAVALVAFLAATAFGGAQEILQHWTARTPDLFDALANAAGAALAALLWWRGVRWLAGRSASRPRP